MIYIICSLIGVAGGISIFVAGFVCGLKFSQQSWTNYKTENNIKDKHTAVYPTYEDKIEAIDNDRIRKNSTKEERLKDIIKHSATSYRTVKDQHI